MEKFTSSFLVTCPYASSKHALLAMIEAAVKRVCRLRGERRVLLNACAAREVSAPALFRALSKWAAAVYVDFGLKGSDEANAVAPARASKSSFDTSALEHTHCVVELDQPINGEDLSRYLLAMERGHVMPISVFQLGRAYLFAHQKKFGPFMDANPLDLEGALQASGKRSTRQASAASVAIKKRDALLNKYFDIPLLRKLFASVCYVDARSRPARTSGPLARAAPAGAPLIAAPAVAAPLAPAPAASS